MGGSLDSAVAVTLAPASPVNYGSRRNTLVDLVVLHATEGSFQSALWWFADPKAQASAHYVIGKSGQIAQCVPEAENAFHAGNSAVNRRSIGIELEAHSADPDAFPHDSLLIQSALLLVADVCRRHSIPIDREHVIGHSEVADPAHPSEEWIHGGAHHHVDPGPYLDLDQFVERVQALAGGAQV